MSGALLLKRITTSESGKWCSTAFCIVSYSTSASRCRQSYPLSPCTGPCPRWRMGSPPTLLALGVGLGLTWCCERECKWRARSLHQRRATTSIGVTSTCGPWLLPQQRRAVYHGRKDVWSSYKQSQILGSCGTHSTTHRLIDSLEGLFG
jgi:hypothetical protein